jgi:hypothetical protein
MALHFVADHAPRAGALANPFAAVWEHYVSTGFIYPAKLERLERALPSIQAGWPLLLAAPAPLFQLHAAWKDGHMLSSIAAFRDAPGAFVIEHAASSDPELMLACIRSCLSAINGDPEFAYARMYFRPENRWPARAAQAIAAAIGPDRAALDVRSYLVCAPDRPLPASAATREARRLPTPQDLPSEDVERATALLVETIGAHRASALGFAVDGPSHAAADVTLRHLNTRYLAAGLRRTRRLLAIYTDGALVGLALCHAASVVMNFSYLCSRTEVVAHPRAPNRAQIITRLAEGAIAEARARGDPYTAMLVSAADAPAACAAGYVDTHHPYAELTWARENSEGAPSAIRAVESVYGTALRRLHDRHPDPPSVAPTATAAGDASARGPSAVADASSP